jgi:hypothetical protein
MTHYTESRIVYLPFAPKAVYPVVWGDISFVLALEEAGSRAVAIRVDSSQLQSVCCGGIPVARKRNRNLQAISFDSDCSPCGRRLVTHYCRTIVRVKCGNDVEHFRECGPRRHGPKLANSFLLSFVPRRKMGKQLEFQCHDLH